MCYVPGFRHLRLVFQVMIFFATQKDIVLMSTYSITTEQHPGHSFIKLANPDDYIVSLTVVLSSMMLTRCLAP